MKPGLMIVDDDESICTQLKWGLEEDYDVQVAGRADEAFRLF